MSVYNKGGSAIIEAFNVNGNAVSAVYDITGNRLPLADITKDLFWSHGKLTKKGKYLVDADNRQMEIRGIGTHHILQYNNLHTIDSLTALRGYCVNCLRISVYLEDYAFASSDDQTAYGYLSHPQDTKAAIETIVDICTELGMYVLLDWHVYSYGANQQGITGTAILHQTEAEDFFEYYSEKYKNSQNIMYEICNEPYSINASQCMSFIQSIRSIIRENDPTAVIVMNRASDGIPALYTAMSQAGITDVFISQHQYGKSVVSQYDGWWNTNNYPLFNTEWGNSNSSGDGTGVDAYAEALLNWHHESGVPHAFWKFTDQTMATSVLVNRGIINSPYYVDGFSDADLSHNGTLFLKAFQSYATTDHIERNIIS
jgi:endoglucanase